MTISQVLFYLLALATCGGAIAVVVSQNVVRMCFWLIVSLGSTAGLFFLLNADFVGATQMLIYVGGTVVLLIFGVMLTASGPYVQIKTSPGELVLAGLVGGAFLLMIASTVYQVDWAGAAEKLAQESAVAGRSPTSHPPEMGNTARDIGLGLIGVRADRDLGKPGDKLSSGYLLPFEIASVHLLVVLIGAAYLARAKRRVDVGVNS